MLERTGAIDVYFEDEIQIVVEDPNEFSIESLEGVLEANEIEYTEITRRPRS